MKGDVLPDAHNVARLCRLGHLNVDGTLSWPALSLRAGETYISVNWLEFLGSGSRAEHIAEVRRVLATKRTLGAASKLAILNVGHARTTVLERTGIAIRFLHEPELVAPVDPSHSGIFGLSADPRSVRAAQRLAAVVSELVPARST